jgi:hypothetical protein
MVAGRVWGGSWTGARGLTTGVSLGASSNASEERTVATKTDDFPQAPSQNVYPWDEWLDGGVWELVPGEDFKGKPATFRASAVAQAARRDGKVRTQKIRSDDGERLYLQFYRE